MYDYKYSLSKKRVMIFFTVFPFLIDISVSSDTWIQKTIDLTINTSFTDALLTVQNQIDKDSTNYRAWFYLAATYNSRMTHFENDADTDQFNTAIDKTIRLIENEQEFTIGLPDSTQAQLLFYLGSAYGYRAYFQGRNGQFISAVANGLKSVGYLNESLEKDSTLYGAYLGIGVYKYWRYSRLSFISWLPMIPDDRDQGIVMINVAISHDSLSKYMAMHQLIYILLDYGKTKEAVELAEIVIKKYPDSQFMWWATAHAYFKDGDYQQADKSYEKLYSLILNDKNKNLNHLLKCQYKRAQIAKYQDNYKQCLQRCDEILIYSEQPFLSAEVRKIVSETEDLRAECRKMLSDMVDGS
jgi:tetratricopeptide (TPR) repeat protein